MVDGHQEPVKGEVAVEYIDGLERLSLFQMEIRAEDGGLAHTDVTGNGYKALFFFYAFRDCRQCLIVTRAKIEKLRIRGDVKGLFLEAVEA
jgi:hypothetical protein